MATVVIIMATVVTVQHDYFRLFLFRLNSLLAQRTINVIELTSPSCQVANSSMHTCDYKDIFGHNKPATVVTNGTNIQRQQLVFLHHLMHCFTYQNYGWKQPAEIISMYILNKSFKVTSVYGSLQFSPSIGVFQVPLINDIKFYRPCYK